MSKVKVSRRALVQRINRKLSKQSQVLKSVRGRNAGVNEGGKYFIVDHLKDEVIATCVDIEKLGRELEALKPYEELEEKIVGL